MAEPIIVEADPDIEFEDNACHDEYVHHNEGRSYFSEGSSVPKFVEVFLAINSYIVSFKFKFYWYF